MRIHSLALMLCLMLSSIAFAKNYSLREAKEELVRDSISVAVAYEKYIMAKEQSRAKTLDLLPSISVDLLIYDYNYTILRSLIPEPSRFFEASASKDLAKAAKVNQLVVTRNLLADLEKSFFLIKYNEEVVESMRATLAVKEELLTRTQEAYDLGGVDYADVYTARRDVIKSQTELYNTMEIVSAEKFALKLILSRKDPTESLTLESTGFYNEGLNYPANVETAMEVAVANSKEVESYNHLINAAVKAKKGETWSWLSWTGVGFDYFAKVEISKANVRKVEHERKQAIYNIRNKVATLYSKIDAHKTKMSLQAELTDMAREDFEMMSEDLDNLRTTVIKVKKAELNLKSAELESRKLEYELEILYIELKRALGAYMISNDIPLA